MKRALLLAALIVGTACAGGYRVGEHTNQDSHFVSVTELVGRPEFFDRQPVSAVGIAQFRENDQPMFRLYASREDLENSIPAAVKIGSFSDALNLTEDEMASLNGKVVIIEGTFRIYKRPKLKPGKAPSSLCVGDCGVPGEIRNIVRITTWPPR
jgi:hypothetical protein